MYGRRHRYGRKRFRRFRRGGVRKSRRTTWSGITRKKSFRRRHPLTGSSRYSTPLVHLRYVKTAALASTGNSATGVATPGWIQLRANGLYDPEVSVGGHQPLNRDRYADLYLNYTVAYSKCSVIVHGSTAIGTTFITGVSCQDSAVAGPHTLSAETYLEQKAGKTKYSSTIQGAHAPQARLSATYSPYRIFRIKSDDPAVGALVTTDPATQAYFEVFCWPTNPWVDVAQGGHPLVTVTVDYYVRFYGRKAITEN